MMPDRSEWQKIGRNSRRKGQNKQRTARRFVEALLAIEPPDKVAGHEEAWTHLPVRLEVKAGAQVAQDMKRYHECLMQHESWETDDRPFLAVLMPDGTTTPYFIISGPDLVALCEIYCQTWGGDAR